MQQSPNEKLALQTIALILAAGVGVWYGSQRRVPEWVVDERPGTAEGRQRTAQLVEQADQANVRSRRRALPLAPGERIDLNTADADELQRLPRVGPSLAARIVEHRAANGPFRSLAEVDAIPGVGETVLAGIAPHVNLPPGPPPEARAAAPRATQAAASRRPGTSPSAAGAGAPLDLNTATAEELQRLPGVGPVLAARIVEWRQANGRFRTVDDLEQVSGIGARTLARLAPLVRAGP
jgi:competence protein ComEA